MEYLQRSAGRGLYSYRRAVPVELREYIGKREIKRSLKTKDRPTSIITAQLLNAKVEEEFAKARSALGIEGSSNDRIALSAIKAFQLAQRLLAGANLESRDIQDGLLSDLIDRAERGVADPIELSQIDVIAGKAAPVPTIREAFDIYREERKLSSTRTSNMKVLSQVSRTQQYLESFLGASRAITKVSRIDAKGFRSVIEQTGVAAATVNKHIATASAVFATVLREHEIEKLNPFSGLQVTDSEMDKAKRDPMSPELLRAYLETAKGFPDDLRDATLLMAHTGARTGEIAHLVAGDVFVEGNDTPFIQIRTNALRGVKTSASNRRIPLVGAALEMVRRRLGEEPLAKDAPFFAALGREGGPTDLSRSQTKMISMTPAIAEAIEAGAKIVPYSVRHTMQDALRAVGAPPGVRGAILGHSSESAIQAAYGQGEDLRVMERYLREAVGYLRL